MTRNILLGMRVPDALIAELVNGQVTPIKASDLLGQGRALVIGVPGAFAPVCTERHLPGLVNNAERLRRSGYDKLVCIVASDPFATDAWSRQVDPERKIRFISDGNLNLARALGLISHEQQLFLGDRSERYMLVVQDRMIDMVRVEKRITDYSCTHTDDLILDHV